MKFINIGYGNMVAVDRIVTLVSPDSAPIKRLIQDAKDDGRVIDVTCGRKTRAVIVTDSEHVILAAIQTETIANRLVSPPLLIISPPLPSMAVPRLPRSIYPREYVQ